MKGVLTLSTHYKILIKEMILKSIEFHSKHVVINADRQHVCHAKIKEKLQRKSPMPFFIPLEICTNVKQHFKNKNTIFFMVFTNQRKQLII